MSLNDNYMTETCVFFLKPFSMTGVMREIDAVGPQCAKMQKKRDLTSFLRVLHMLINARC